MDLDTVRRIRWAAVLLIVPASLNAAGPRQGMSARAAIAANDVGRPDDLTQRGRWSKPASEGLHTYRVRPAGSLSRVGLPAWWAKGDAPSEDALLAVTYKDTTAEPVSVGGWTGVGGIYGYPVLGLVGGKGDGAWRTKVLLVGRHNARRHDDGPWKGKWSILFAHGGELAVARLRIVRLAEADRPKLLAAARAERARRIAALLKGFKVVPRERKEPPLGEPSAEQRRLGFIPFAPSYLTDVYPDTVPSAAQRGARPLRAYATPGEAEPIQLAARALRDVTLSAAVSDLVGPGRLSAGSDVTVEWIECMPLRVGSSWGKSCRGSPAWLRPGAPRPVKAGTCQAWLITVRAGPGAKAGEYTGTVTLSAEGGRAKASFPLTFRVLPFALDPADHVARGAYVSNILPDEHIRDLAAHGMNSGSLFSSGTIRPKLSGGRCVADVPESTNRYLKKLKAAGFVRAVHFGGGDRAAGDPAGLASATRTKVGTPKFAEYYGQFWADIRRQERAGGWPEMICCPFDEPVKSSGKTANYVACYQAVKKASPETKVFCVFMNRTWPCKKLGLQSDIWSCNGAFGTNQAEKLRLAAAGTRKLLYTYTGCYAGTRPRACRYNAGFLPWHHDADGTFFWAYLWQAEDSFNDLDGGHRDWSPVARDADGRLYRCVSWEAYREGCDDRRYVETALRLARQKNRKDILAKLDALKKGVVVGTESRTSVETKGLDDFFVRIADAAVLDLYRARVVRMIMEMLGEK